MPPTPFIDFAGDGSASYSNSHYPNLFKRLSERHYKMIFWLYPCVNHPQLICCTTLAGLEGGVVRTRSACTRRRCLFSGRLAESLVRGF